MVEEQQVTKEPQQVTTKDPKKVEAGKTLAEWNRKNKEELKAQEGNKKEKQESSVNLSSTQCYGIGAIIVVVAGVVFIVYQVWGNPFKKGKDVSSNSASIASTHVIEPSHSKMFEME